MKKIIYSLLILATLASCDTLDLKPLDKLSEDDTWTDPALVQLYVNANYNAILHGYEDDVFAAASDESYDLHNHGNMFVLQKGEVSADNISMLSGRVNYWSLGFRQIRNMNVFFSKIEQTPVDGDAKGAMVGEMKFLRAFVFANLIWRYGGVPLITKVYELNEDYTLSRDSYADCVEFIVKELDEAIALLPAKQSGAGLGRASADACRALKSRVLLYAASKLNNPSNDRAKWQRAADAAGELLGAYALHPDYQELFLEANDEIIWARYFTQSTATDYNWKNGRNGDDGGNYQGPTQNLVNAYEMKATGLRPYTAQPGGTLVVNPQSGYDQSDPYSGRDPRFYATILHDESMWMGRQTETFKGGLDSPESKIQPWNASLTGYALKKFLNEDIPPTGNTERPTNPWIYFRYAEILLNYAEAQFELGNEDIAREYLNLVRSRLSVKMPPVTDSGEKLRARIHNERMVELAFEEHRFFDVRRWMIAQETENADLLKMTIVKQTGGKKAYTVSVLSAERDFRTQHYRLPIPRAEIEKSLNSLEQNPDY
ncbi:RagB/SusD family nutrient uptake outer membrane protein [Sphingobacterium sp. JB170]|uniref:RagB/SusD family nutrient uptake outer membrane protein n=1 Tax=Sphingobacterium sp. JB170 TaxID=1434842 RepID=UPI00097E83DE|nr:RagB/SusD family nutrient uptake outer membrane protein [Sphingobacterium sp. JB170]SJN19255.1 putative outer membrane protein probably involved in nutrient binding [Sphingobacterium sp. JB170]